MVFGANPLTINHKSIGGAVKRIQEADVANKKVFVRVDFNVPIQDGVITDDNRIRQALPTIQYLIDKNCKIILGTHLGKPKGTRSEETSTKPCADKLAELLGREVKYADSVIGQEVWNALNDLPEGGVLMLANLRWDPKEEEDDEGFGRELANFAEIYINDAFAVSHRANASVSAIAKFLPSYGGLLLQKEVENLSKVIDNPPHPFVLVIGGVKIEDKAAMIDKLAPLADKVLVGGGVANTFARAKGEDISQSVFDDEMVDACAQMINKYGEKIVLPLDYEREEVEGGFKNLDLGPNTRHDYYEIVKGAAMTLWNGNLGYTEDDQYKEASRTVALAMRDSGGQTIVAGGDTAGFIDNEKLADTMTFISTGGGAALEFLAGLELPGIKVVS